MFRAILNKSFVDASNVDNKSSLFQTALEKIPSSYPAIHTTYDAFDTFKNPYIILALLALSKATNTKLFFHHRNAPIEGTSAADSLRSYEQHRRSLLGDIAVCNTMRIQKVKMAPSVFNRAAIKETFTEFGYNVPELLNNSIDAITRGKIHGIAVNQQTNSIIIIMDKLYPQWRYDPYLEAFTLSIIYAAFRHLINSFPDVPIIFDAISDQVGSIPREIWNFDLPLSSMPPQIAALGDQIHEIVTDWVKSQPELCRNTETELEDFIKSLNEAEVTQAENNLTYVRNRMDSYQRQLQQEIKAYQEACAKLTFVQQHKLADTKKRVTEFLEFLKLTTAVKEYQFYNHSIFFQVEQPLYLNEDAGWDILKKNLTDEDKKNLLEHIFIINDYKLLTSATVKLDITNLSINSTREIDLVPDTIPHPHIMQYNCFGTHLDLILDRLKENDLIGCTEQIIEAVSSLNWSDAPVMRHFYSIMNSVTSKCIEHNGRRMTVREAIDEINA